MLTDILLPHESKLMIDSIDQTEDQTIKIGVKSIDSKGICPNCQTISQRVHSRYQRRPADLPLAGKSVYLHLLVRRFFCDNSTCRQMTFTERTPTVVKPYARRTNRLANQQRQVGFATSGEAGARLLTSVGMPLSPDTLLRLLRDTSDPEFKTPRVLGVDDWAFRRGTSYGTILVDLETHQVVDLLPDRSAESLASWLNEHPGVEILSRDRGKEYIKGATDGAPQAIQVADRWHLLKNLREAFERLLEGKPDGLKAAAEQTPSEQTTSSNPLDGAFELTEKTSENNGATENQPWPKRKPVDNEEDCVSSSLENSSSVNPAAITREENHEKKGDCQSTSVQNDVPLLNDNQPISLSQLTGCQESLQITPMVSTNQQATTDSVKIAETDSEKLARNPYKQQRFLAVKQLNEQGVSQREISRRLNMHRQTVRKYIHAESCPRYPTNVKRYSKLSQYDSILKERCALGSQATVIFDELRQLGFGGSYSLVAKRVAQIRQSMGQSNEESSKASSVAWSSSRGAWLLVKPEDQLTAEDKAALQQIRQADETIDLAYTLGQRFCSMVRQQNPKALLPWLEDVVSSGVEAFTNFAKSIKADISAVTNALSLPWSQGQTEGQVNRLKLIKRQMYGRAKFDLLRRRVLGCPITS